ncbi:MAG: hypothetical protein HKP08_00795 [Flavobacteriaceae bacterium]|nr:hypothetical protein [Flavobacteriaceae bacterium]
MRKAISIGTVILMILLGYGFSLKPEVEVEQLRHFAGTPASLQVCEFIEISGPVNLNKKARKINYKNTNPMILGRKYTAYKEALAFKESRGNYKSINTLGYIGKYQFGSGTLALLGVKDTLQFLHSAVLQELVFAANLARNKWVLRREIKEFSGEIIKGIIITESGLLAAAHLAGPGNVKKYLYTHGKTVTKDAYGTTIENYLNAFSGYDLSFIKAHKNIKVKGGPYFRVL